MSLRGNISKSKIDKCVFRLTKPISDKTNKIIEEQCKYISDVARSMMPKEVLEFEKKYPNLIKRKSSIFIQLDADKYLNLYSLDCPYLDNEDMDKLIDILLTDEEHHKYLLSTYEDYKKLEEEKHTLKNQIRCTLQSLKTYSKVKEEFPEAYEVFLDMENNKDENLCDDVENVRAKLNSKIKSVNKINYVKGDK